MYVTYENSQQCITSYKDVEPHPRIPFVPLTRLGDAGASGSLVSEGLSIECNGIDSSILKSAPNSDFRPTRLLRTSDMAVVPGTEAKNGYCALSYPWEWSGDIETVETNDDDNDDNDDNSNDLDPTTTSTTSFPSPRQRQRRVDRGHHIYVERPARPFTNLMFGVAHRETEQKNPFERYLQRYRRMESESNPNTHCVSFTEIIKQLCWMFEIDYIWYDQLCILQSNHQDKQNEIRQMHQIYGNAQFTLVMIPEMRFNSKYVEEIYEGRTPTQRGIQECIQQIATSKWAQRTWTFEEAVLSKRLLFVGRNVHVWSDTLVSTTHPWHVLPRLQRKKIDIDLVPTSLRSTVKLRRDKKEQDKKKNSVKISDLRDESHVRFVQNLCTITPDTISASSALWHIHRGKSTQDHDKIFALANIFPRLMDGMNDFSYDQPLLPLMSQFYNNLIQHDLSILCFGKAAVDIDMYHGMGRKSNTVGITSWTGVGGSHMLQTPTHPMAPTTSFGRYFVTEEGYLSIYSKSIPVSIDIVDRCPHTSAVHTYMIKDRGTAGSLKATMDHGSYLQVVSYGLTPTHWLSPWEYSASTLALDDLSLSTTNNATNTTTTWFSFASNDNEVHKRCVILIDVAFDIGMDGFIAYPVITQYGKYRTAMGMCIARNLQLLYNPDELEMDEFTIR
ncbi:hypothetical protein BDA99DRAFT_529703 [Phascolomyces articulosus]|uniref:Heterokaryon incompatibility domain-containing protein n=1 Tax=Phascolomyces articulosus TaxID=60185 RepID=A0AAD5JVJ6_9FUNG|nr:hypothetical protein BDA99DRAFT_529703 [Phascolomyces articulosus]